MANDALPLTLTAVKSLVFTLNKKCSELSHNKHGDQIVLLFQEPFLHNRVYLQQNMHKQVDSTQMQQKIVVTAKPKVCVRNVNKKLKRNDERIKEFKFEVSALSKENHRLYSRLAAAQRASEKNGAALS